MQYPECEAAMTRLRQVGHDGSSHWRRPEHRYRGTVLIYKILLPAEWAEFEATGRFDGSSFDHSSGFIHCSSRDQVAATAVRVFDQEPALVVVALDTDVLGDSVRWEQASHGGAFPHVYAPLHRDAVVAVHQVPGAQRIDDLLGSTA
jgi:uncharacterized protein (DUF952 family)